MEYATLNNGVKMPMAGIGTFLLTPDEAEASCVSALQDGYRLIDTANAYVNEKAVGRAMKKADTIVIGSPVYWHNICGSVRNVLDRFYGKVENGSLSGRRLYFVFQGAAPEKWMLEAGDYTMKRFAGLYGMTYGGMVTNKNEATKLGKNI